MSAAVARGRLPAVLVALIVVGACEATTPSPSSPVSVPPSGAGLSGELETCDELVPGFIPPGLSLRSRTTVWGPPSGVVASYADAAGERELTLLSGVGGEVGGTETGRTFRIRGHEATELSSGDTRAVVWLERPADQPCHQYTVFGVGLTESDWERVLAELR